jgi:hypothetical protein
VALSHACPAEFGLDPQDRDDSQFGRLVENRIVEAIETSARLVIESFRPVTDSGGYDWAGVPFGRFDMLRLLQIKGTSHLRTEEGTETVQIMFDLGALVPHRNTSVLFPHFDIKALQITDPLWLVPSLKLAEVTRPYYCTKHRREHFHFIANHRLDAHDAASRYQVRRDTLAQAIFPGLTAGRPQSVALSPISSEEGDFFESAFITQFLRDCTGAEKLLRPNIDLGRDLLALTLDPFHWASLAIKGTARKSHGNEVIEVLIKERTFIPHPRHFVLVEYFDRPSKRLHEWSWLIPSLAFARLANRSSVMFQMVTSLNRSHNRWSRWAVQTDAVAATFMRWMRRPPAV